MRLELARYCACSSVSAQIAQTATAVRDVELHGVGVPKGAFVLPMAGAANRDPEAFPAPPKFDISRFPNPPLGFGHGIHFCLGAGLARLEARIALNDLLQRTQRFEYASDQPWQPRAGLIVHGPVSLPILLEEKRAESAYAQQSS